MKFESDVFISYAHIDNETVVEGQEGWVTTFHRALELRVAQLLGEKPKIFRDPKLQGNDYFSDTLVDQLPATAILVSVFSPRYLKSEWCSRELDEFVKASAGSGGIRVADKSRVFKVLKTPVPPEEHPEPVRPLLGYEFFKIDPDTGRARELDKVFGPEAEREFWLKLDDLAHDLAALLETLKSGGSGRPPGAAPRETAASPDAADDGASGEQGAVAGALPTESAAGGTGGAQAVVYLAQVTSDLKEEHAAVKRDLKQAGHDILPDSPLPLEAEELQRFVAEQLDRCSLSVHLIGGTYGIVPEGTKLSLAQLQNDLAIERGKQGDFGRLVWIPPELEVDSDRQRDFLERLRSDPRIEHGADLLEVPLEDLKTQIHAALEPPKKEEPPAGASPAPGAAGGSQIYLICDQRDLDAINPVADFLFDQGHEVTLPAFEGDEAEVRDDHEENLKACEAALIYWGGGNNLWLRRKLRELKKAAGLGREEPWRAEGVLIAPPESPDKTRLRTHDFFVLKQAGGEFSPEALAPFLAALAQEANAP